MKVLLSAYACEPDKGSEPGVGWNWALALCRMGHEVLVLTRSNNRSTIEQAVRQRGLPLRFAYYDLGRAAQRWKHWPGGIYLYYLFWQIGAYRLAKRLHVAERFDCAQHITFVSYRQPSFMGGLGVPFLFGPVGGGETMPRTFRKGISLSGRVAEALRDLGSRMVAYDPLMRMTFASADCIAVTSVETLARIPRRFHAKCVQQLAIGIDGYEIGAAKVGAREVGSPGATPPSHPQFLFIGRLLYWKGLHLAFRALAEVRQSLPQVTLRVIGQGSGEAWLRNVARKAGVADAVEWIAAKPHSEIPREFERSLALVFPSLHDSGGMVVLEAMAAGVPVICLDLGGPGVLVNSSSGMVVPTQGASEEAVVMALARAMLEIATNAPLRARLSAGAMDRARQMTWDEAARRLYSVFQQKRR